MCSPRFSRVDKEGETGIDWDGRGASPKACILLYPGRAAPPAGPHPSHPSASPPLPARCPGGGKRTGRTWHCPARTPPARPRREGRPRARLCPPVRLARPFSRRTRVRREAGDVTALSGRPLSGRLCPVAPPPGRPPAVPSRPPHRASLVGRQARACIRAYHTRRSGRRCTRESQTPRRAVGLFSKCLD